MYGRTSNLWGKVFTCPLVCSGFNRLFLTVLVLKSLTVGFVCSCSARCLAPTRYKILAAKDIKDSTTPEKAAQIILDTIQLDTEQFRLGKTKVHKPSSSNRLNFTLTNLKMMKTRVHLIKILLLHGRIHLTDTITSNLNA